MADGRWPGLPQVSAGLLVITWLCAKKACLLISYAIKQGFVPPYQAMPAIAVLASCGMSVQRGAVMAMATSVIEDFADQIRVCADQGWKINIFIRYIAPFP
ncbi:TPA: hypothetical protein RG418_001134 [Aeromonas hydrophila]|nr:hypothetical protein [Aeromonas hydrophila]